MNERLTIQDLIDLLAAKHSMTKKDAEAFVKEFFLLIENALENEKIVKIKGLGTFKLVDVDSRESIHVNTGERFQIKGHTKVAFTPDIGLRDTINKPFAHFETVLLKDNTILEDTPLEEPEEEESGEDMLVSAIEIQETNESTQEQIVQDEPITEDVADEEFTSTEKTDEIVDETIEKEIVVDEQISDNLIKEDEIKVSAETIIARELQKANLEPEKHDSLPEIENNKITSDSNVQDKKEQSPVPYLIFTIVIVLLLCGGAILFIYFPDLFSSSTNKNEIEIPVATQSVQPETLLSDTLIDKDTVKNINPIVPPKDTIVLQSQPQRQPVAENEVNISEYTDSASYKITGTKTKYTIKEGETLTRVSLRFYGTKAMWPYIVKHNPKVIKNPNHVPYGTTIEIPELTKK